MEAKAYDATNALGTMSCLRADGKIYFKFTPKGPF